MISVIIPHYPLNQELEDKLQRCVKSLSGYDELILVVNEGIGFSKAINQGMRLAKGDYLVVVSNDTYVVSGDLASLCDSTAVTSPRVNNQLQELWGCFFCLPRWVYEKVGGFDEQFYPAYWEDNDYILRLREAKVPMKPVASVQVRTEGGQTMKFLDSSQAHKESNEKFIKKWGQDKVLESNPIKYD